MATKLKNLHLTKVDLVDEGANPRADIKLTKRKDGEAGGEIPEDNPEDKTISLLKRFANWLKGEGFTFADVEKAATSFEEQMTSVSTEVIQNEMWDVTYALRSSLCSILCDTELDGIAKEAAMNESLEQFNTAMQGYITNWCSGQSAELKKSKDLPDETDLALMTADHQTLGKMIEKAKVTKGELEDMLKIDKSKMTPEERAAYDDLIRKYAVDADDLDDVTKAAAAKADDVDDEELIDEEAKKKGATAKSKTAETAPAAAGAEALVADLRAEVEKMRDDALTKEITAVAKKYEVIGKKAEDLVPTLKSLKAAGGTAYDDMIALLDDLVATQESSGVFGEIGKSREGSDAEKSSIAKARSKAAELRKSRPELTAEQALDEVLLSDPELLAEFDK